LAPCQQDGAGAGCVSAGASTGATPDARGAGCKAGVFQAGGDSDSLFSLHSRRTVRCLVSWLLAGMGLACQFPPQGGNFSGQLQIIGAMLLGAENHVRHYQQPRQTRQIGKPGQAGDLTRYGLFRTLVVEQHGAASGVGSPDANSRTLAVAGRPGRTISRPQLSHKQHACASCKGCMGVFVWPRQSASGRFGLWQKP